VTPGESSGMAAAPDFDAAYYLRENPDVAEAGFDPLEHYLLYGRHEGRAPNERAWLDFNSEYDHGGGA
jgi:hypothetical protein